MGRELCDHYPGANAVFDLVSEATGRDLRDICWNSDEDTLRRTENAQIALYTCGLAAFRALRAGAPEISISFCAGHSIGEYAALSAAGWLTAEDGARLVKKRGELMAESGRQHPGTMAAILGLDREPLEAVCASVDGIVVVANDNCPGQLVISGEVNAVRQASEKALEAGAKRALPLNVSGGFHSPLMTEPSIEMGKSLRDVSFAPGSIPVISNVIAAPGEDWPELLEAQLRSPVRWTETMQFMVAAGVTLQLECGSGEVLGGLMKRTDKSVRSVAIQDSASLSDALEIAKE